MSVLTQPADMAPLTRAAVAERLKGTEVDVPNTLYKWGMFASLGVTLAVLVLLVGSVFVAGIEVLLDRGLEFLTVGNSSDPAEAGMWQAIFGSALIAVFVVSLAFPLGIAAAVYLEEYSSENWLTRLISINIRNLAGVPSIVYGLLGLSIFVKAIGGFTGGRSIIAGGLTLAVLVLPIVIITSAEALRAVPDSIREAGFGVGAGRWEVIRAHVLPYAAPGILTGTVLSLARALGEAAPLILVGASVGFFSSAEGTGLLDRVQGTFTAMPNLTYGWARQPGEDWKANTSAAILVMLVVIFAFNAVAILLRNRFDRKRDY
jgi:phosphate transport system permease protein